METYYITLRPSSLNLLHRTILECIANKPNRGTLFPTKGSLILFAVQTSETNFHRVVDAIDKWDIAHIRELVSEITITKAEDTLLMNMNISPEFEIQVSSLISHVRTIPMVNLQTHFPKSAILYKGEEELIPYLQGKNMGFNMGEWLVCINKNGSPPLFIKDRN